MKRRANVRIAVSFTHSAHIPWPEFLRAGPGVEACSPAAIGAVSAARLARRARVGPPAWYRSVVTGQGSVVLSRCRFHPRLIPRQPVPIKEVIMTHITTTAAVGTQ